MNSALWGFSLVLFNHEILRLFYSVACDMTSPRLHKLFLCCLPTETIDSGNAFEGPEMYGDCLWKMQIGSMLGLFVVPLFTTWLSFSFKEKQSPCSCRIHCF